MIIEIDEELLGNQIAAKPTECAVALAIMRERPDLNVWAFYSSLSIYTTNYATATPDEHIRIENDKEIRDWMHRNDKYATDFNIINPAEPITIEVDIEAGLSRLLSYNNRVEGISVEDFHACSNCNRVPEYKDPCHPDEGQRLLRSDPFSACAYCAAWIFNPWTSKMLHPLNIFSASVEKICLDHHKKDGHIQNTRTHYKVREEI